jgi:hypothetical protein
MMKNETMITAYDIEAARELAELNVELRPKNAEEFREFVHSMYHGITKPAVQTGGYRHCIILDSCVIKLPRILLQDDDEYVILRNTMMLREAEAIAKYRSDPLLRPLFPETLLVKGETLELEAVALVQEYVPGVGSRGLAKWQDFADIMGFGWDMHMWNYGWRTVGNTRYPVFIDIEIGELVT